MSDVSRLGQRLRRFRRMAKLSQEELARQSGVSRSLIATIETGSRRDITLRKVLRLAHVLGVSVEVLAGFDPLEGFTEEEGREEDTLPVPA